LRTDIVRRPSEVQTARSKCVGPVARQIKPGVTTSFSPNRSSAANPRSSGLAPRQLS
jgi:hypothetical protein